LTHPPERRTHPSLESIVLRPGHPRVILAGILLTATASAATAQHQAPDPPAAARTCRGRADDRACGLRFEPRFGAYTGTNLGDEIRTNYRLGFGGGLTHSVGERAAVGASLWLMAHEGTSASILVQYRQWLGKGFVMDVEFGSYLAAVLEGEIGNYPLRFPSPVLDVGLSYRDWVGVRARVESLALRGAEPVDPNNPNAGAVPVDWRKQAVLVGAQLGRGLGWLGWVASAVTVVVIGATCCN